MQSVIIFFIINLFFCLWNPTYKNTQARVVYWTCCVSAILLIGLRGNIDNDYATYVDMFSSDHILVEPTFLIIRFLVRDIIGGGIAGLMLIYAAISVTIRFIAIKRYSPFIFLSVIIWIGNLMILQDMTQIRAAVASSIMLLATGAHYERKPVPYFSLTLIATMFHVSALLMIPLWLFTSKKINKWLWTGIIATGYILALKGIYLTSLLSLLPFEYIQTKLLTYSIETTDDGGANILGLFQITRIGLFMLLLWNAQRIQSHNRYTILLLKIMACGLVALPLFRNNIVFGLRITELLTSVDILLYPMVIYLFPIRSIGKFIIICYSAAIMYGRLFLEGLLK